MKTRFLKAADSLLGPLACRVLARGKASGRRPLPPEARTLADFQEKSVLVIRPGGMGDAVLLLPALSGLKSAFPDCEIDVLCESRNEPVFRMSGVVRETICYDRSPLRALRKLRAGRWPVVADTEQFHHASAAMAAYSRTPVCIGFAMNPARQDLYERTVPYDTAGRESVQFSRLLRAAAGIDFPVPPLEGLLSGERLPELPPIMGKIAAGAPAPGRYATLHAGASDVRKRWPMRRYCELAGALRAKFGLDCILVGDSSDAALAQESGSRPLPDARGRLSLVETAALIANAALHVGPDSGLAHVAVAVGVRPVVLFGPADPAKWGPPEGFGAVVSAPVPCAPCAMFGTMKRCRGLWCMDGITVPAVVEAAGALLR